MASVCGHDNNIGHYAWQELTSEQKRYVEIHLNETDEIRENAIREMKRWVEESDDLCAGIDEFFILRFLRVCKFNLEETKIRMRNYCKQRFELPEWSVNRDPFLPELKALLDLGLCLPLRKPDEQGKLILIIRQQYDPRIHKLTDFIKISLIAIEVALKYYPAASIYGYTMFIDMTGISLRHVAQLRPSILMHMAHSWQSCYPMITNSIIVFNSPIIFDITLRIFKSFLSEEMKSKFHFYSHRTMQNLFKNIPINILPVEYGGTDGTIQELIEYWKKLIEGNRDWLMNGEEDMKH